MKSFSELTSASQVNNADLLAISQTSGSGYASKKTTVKDITDKSNLNLADEYDSTSSYAAGDYCIYESVLYKCTASTTGTFDSTKWTSVVVTDEMGSGGGGGTGGHTIINENGTSMTARAGLQFTGNVVVTDDATNNKTIVSIPSGGGHNYSTTEHIVGTWIDGSTLYEKSYHISQQITETSFVVDSTLDNTKVKVRNTSFGSLVIGGNYNDAQYMNGNITPTSGIRLGLNNTGLWISCGNPPTPTSQNPVSDFDFTIQYTKSS